MNPLVVTKRNGRIIINCSYAVGRAIGCILNTAVVRNALCKVFPHKEWELQPYRIDPWEAVKVDVSYIDPSRGDMERNANSSSCVLTDCMRNYFSSEKDHWVLRTKGKAIDRIIRWHQDECSRLADLLQRSEHDGPTTRRGEWLILKEFHADAWKVLHDMVLCMKHEKEE